MIYMSEISKNSKENSFPRDEVELSIEKKMKEEYCERIKKARRLGMKLMIWGGVIFVFISFICLMSGRLYYYIFPLSLFTATYGFINFAFAKNLVNNNYDL